MKISKSIERAILPFNTICSVIVLMSYTAGPSEAQLGRQSNVLGNRSVAYDSLGVRGALKVEGAATFTGALSFSGSTSRLGVGAASSAGALVRFQTTTTDALILAITNEDGTVRAQIDSVGRGSFGVAASSAAAVKVQNIAQDALMQQWANEDGTVRASIDSAGLGTFVGLTTTGAITATSQTIASGAITASGTNTFTKAQIGAGGSGTLRALIDSVTVSGDSLRVYYAGKWAATYLHN